MITKYLAATISTKANGLGPRQFSFIASTDSIDRVNESIDISGLDIAQYKKNPVMLLQHDRSKPIARASVTKAAGRLEGVGTFPPPGKSPTADEAFALVQSGVLGAVSIGYVEKEAQPAGGGRVRVTKAELLEISIVSIPCNADALITGVSEKAQRASVFGSAKDVRAIDHDAERRRRKIKILSLEADVYDFAPPSPEAARAQHKRKIERLAAKTQPVVNRPAARPIFTGDVVLWSHQMSEYLEQQCLKTSPNVYGRDPIAQREERLRRIRELT
ncbi:HK97 family phage prohead protease [Methylocystis sp.]|uniref:HK97 family phage prohead protease n=1 Tax=Methylocystis sp. TaxID=1911079 RepID=UPI003D14C24E